MTDRNSEKLEKVGEAALVAIYIFLILGRIATTVLFIIGLLFATHIETVRWTLAGAFVLAGVVDMIGNWAGKQVPSKKEEKE